MGEVYLARELATERDVAMKFLWAANDPSAHERFLVEVRALAKLDHPNIVRVLAADLHRRSPYFTMDYAAGGTLARWVEDRGPLAPRDAAELIRTVAGALAAAHAAGVIHRDVKPSNILLSGDRSEGDRRQETGDSKKDTTEYKRKRGSDLSPVPCPLTPRLSDFGLAKRLDRDDGLSATTGGMGTPGYMPPEQVSSKHGELGSASDVYGLGATLFHLLTGRAPFRGATPAEVTIRVVTEPAPRVRTVAPGVPIELEAIVAKCLEKNAADRYPTATALADDLGRFLSGRAPLAPLLSWRRRAYRTAVRNRGRVAVGLSAAIALAMVFVVGMVAARPTPEDLFADARKQLAEGKAVTLIGETGRPKYHRAVFGNAVVGDSISGDGTCSITSLGNAITELVPDTGCDNYRLTAELRQVDNPGANLASADRVGLYFGYATAVVDGRPAHLMQSVRFNDSASPDTDDPPNPPRFVRVGPFGLLQRLERNPYITHCISKQFPLTRVDRAMAEGRGRGVAAAVGGEVAGSGRTGERGHAHCGAVP
jgi:serine/threonine-protein kinase